MAVLDTCFKSLENTLCLLGTEEFCDMCDICKNTNACLEDMSTFNMCNGVSAIKSEPVWLSEQNSTLRVFPDMGDSFESDDETFTASKGNDPSFDGNFEVPSPSSSTQLDRKSSFTSQDFLISSTYSLSDLDDSENGASSERRLCLVCGDVSSGYHYGVSSCEACKAFFKRSIQGNIEYTCPGNGQCEITKRRRKSCQACRFQKCLNMGMLREGVRMDRVRGGRQKYKRLSLGSTTSAESPPPIPKKICLEVSEGNLLTRLMAIEPKPLKANPDHQPLNTLKFMSVLSDLADRELVDTIEWAKQLDGFIGISLSDQMSLLKAGWLDVLCLNMCYRSKPFCGRLVFASDFALTEEELRRTGTNSELCDLSVKLANNLTSLDVTREEFVLLKALVIMNTDIKVDNREIVQTAHDKLHDALIEYTTKQYGGNPRRVGDLLMVLPILTHMKILARGYWFEVKNDGRVTMHKLLLEMLGANP